METPTDTEIWAAFEDMVPEDAVPLHGWRILEYIDEAGGRQTFMVVHGEPSLIETTGVLGLNQFLAQQAVVGDSSFEASDPYGEDNDEDDEDD